MFRIMLSPKEFENCKVLAKEAVHAFVKSEVASVKENIKKIFDSFDTDKSGFIDKDELRGVTA